MYEAKIGKNRYTVRRALLSLGYSDRHFPAAQPYIRWLAALLLEAEVRAVG